MFNNKRDFNVYKEPNLHHFKNVALDERRWLIKERKKCINRYCWLSAHSILYVFEKEINAVVLCNFVSTTNHKANNSNRKNWNARMNRSSAKYLAEKWTTFYITIICAWMHGNVSFLANRSYNWNGYGRISLYYIIFSFHIFYFKSQLPNTNWWRILFDLWQTECENLYYTHFILL